MTTSIQEAYKLALSKKAQIKVMEMKSGGKEEYKKFFDSVLAKFKVSSPAELDTEKKKEFFEYIDSNWESKNEKD
jgi:hypothetical protein